MRVVVVLFVLALLFTGCETEPPQRPARPDPEPISVLDDGAGEEEKENAREQYFENIHRAAPGTDWERLEAHNAMARHRKRQARAGAEKSVESFADGLLTGEWFERGSKFTAGSVFDVVQDPDDPNRLFIMSAGGSLWELDYASLAYSLVNHDIFFEGDYLGLVPTPEGRNLVAFSDRRPLYSADDGQSWEFARVFYEGNEIEGREIRNSFSTQVFGDLVLTTLQLEGAPYELFASRDGGRTYHFLGLPSGEDASVTHLYTPAGTDRLFVLMKRMYNDPAVMLYEAMPTASGVNYALLNTIPVAYDEWYRARLTAAELPATGELRFYVQADVQLFRSDDGGTTFDELPNLEDRPWSQQSVFVRADDPDFVAYGNNELWVSYDAGETFARPNRWYDYYDDPTRYIHADIMRMVEITDAAGQPQLLVSNHGGLNRYNPADSLFYGIAPEGLNVAQYYDVSTNPGDRRLIYAGSQDQGFQVLEESGPDDREVLGGYQDFSGDYGHTVFAEGGNVYATAYPFGTIYAFWDVLEGGYNWARYEVEHGDEFIWIAPMMSPPREDGRSVFYVAGGSADESSEGSHLIEVTLETEPGSPDFGTMTGRNLPFDFIDAAAGNLSALTYSPLDPERFYVATEEGRFFRSDDAGENWTETLNFLPSGWYLYGQAIHASQTEPETVWLGGSGYSNPPVWRSTDGGVNFEPVSEGLPATTVNGLAASPTESMIFAATEAGPFVYLASEERWFDLSGQFAPTMRYVSVEFIPERNLARFGTYGRGAWDFQVDELVSAEAPLAQTERLRVYPNPASVSTTVEGTAAGYRLYDLAGREVRRVTGTGPRTQVPLNGLEAGLYFLQPLDENGRAVGLAQRLVKE